MCKFCVKNQTDDEKKREQEVKKLFAATLIASLANDIYTGVTNVYALPLVIYNRTAGLFEKAVKGAIQKKKALNTIQEADFDKLERELIQNVYRFSAAKTYQHTKISNGLLINKTTGKLKTFDVFLEDYKKVFKEFNENYLAAEYNTAVYSAEKAVQWDFIQQTKSEYPFLTYVTAGDERVRAEHEILNNITKPVDDPFWSTYYPPNGWNCRCFVTQESEGEITDTSNIKLDETKVPEVWRFNSGQKRIIFSDEHPYYKIEAKDSSLSTNNFNLPLPK